MTNIGRRKSWERFGAVSTDEQKNAARLAQRSLFFAHAQDVLRSTLIGASMPKRSRRGQLSPQARWRTIPEISEHAIFCLPIIALVLPRPLLTRVRSARCGRIQLNNSSQVIELSRALSRRPLSRCWYAILPRSVANAASLLSWSWQGLSLRVSDCSYSFRFSQS